MKFFEIKYRRLSWNNTNVIVVSADSSAEAIKKAGLQGAYEYSVSEYVPYKLGNKSFSRRHGTYNAMWCDKHGKPAFWGNYNPDNGGYYLSTPEGTVAIGTWVERRSGDYEYQCYGTYSYNEVRRALQLGVMCL